jgi:hypothetical protein
MPSRQRTAQGCGLCVRQVSSHWGVVERLATGSISGQPSEEPSAPLLSRGFVLVVGTAGFEPATPCSQSSSHYAPCGPAKTQVTRERKPPS